MDVPRCSLGPAESPVIESYSLYTFLCELMGNMWAVSEVGIVAVEHEDHSFGSRGGGVSIGGQFDCFPFVVEDCKVDEVSDGVGMLTLRVGGGVLILLGVLN